MPALPPVTVVGAGLAGACTAAALAPHTRVTVWDDGRPGATAAAAGLVNPFLGRKAKRAWRAGEALAALRVLSEGTGAMRWTGLLRPAGDIRQARAFAEQAGRHDTLDWLSPEAAHAAAPALAAPHGALRVREGGSADLDALCGALLARASSQGAELHTGRWTLDAITDKGGITILCAGAALRTLAPALPLHAVKGQTVRLRPAAPLALPPVAGRTYLVPQLDGTALVGATFEHAFEHDRPTPEATAELVARAAGLVPALAGAEVVEARAGLRMTVPATASPRRLPWLGPVDASGRLWVFGGLGAKGLLTAPLLASWLPRALADPGCIPAELRPPRP